MLTYFPPESRSKCSVASRITKRGQKGLGDQLCAILFPRLKLPQCFSVFYLLLTSQYKVKLSLFWPGGNIDRSQMSYFGENVLCERYLINVFVLLLLLLLLLNCKTAIFCPIF